MSVRNERAFAVAAIVLIVLAPVASVTAKPVAPTLSGSSPDELDSSSPRTYIGTNVLQGENGEQNQTNGNGGNGNGDKGNDGNDDGDKGDSGENSGNDGWDEANNGNDKGDKGNNGGNANDGGKANNGKKGNNGKKRGWNNGSARNRSAAPGPLSNVTIDLGENATALEHRRAVLTVLRNASATDRDHAVRLRRLVAALDRTQKHFLDANRATSAALFRADKRVVAPLHPRASNVTVHLLTAESKLSRQAIADAEHVKRVLDERNVTYDIASVEENITAAKEAFQQAERLGTRTTPGAVEHYRRAWTHAQRAIDVMDEAVEPRVEIYTRSDIPHSNSTDHAVNATVFDVRPYELNATLTVVNATNEASTTSSRPVDLQVGTNPVTVVAVNLTVRLARQIPTDDRTYTLNLTATDPGVDIADSGYDTSTSLDLHQPQHETEPLRLDGDGLPDRYERSILGTDPLADDSDLPETPWNEAANGTIDGLEDPDGETLVNYVEYRIGTDPLAADTDNDNLTDGFESQFPNVDPLVVDTDGDNVADGREDLDNDTLSNAREERVGTHPLTNDTDTDGLDDAVEIDEYGTDPLTTDSDDDRLTDPTELKLGTNPLVADTDDDGTVDGNETFTTKTTDEETGVQIAATGNGDVASGISITKAANNTTSTTRVGPLVRVTNETSFDNATVTIPVEELAGASNETRAATASEVVVYQWNTNANETWHPVETTVNDDGTVTATVASSGFFTVRTEDEWHEATTASASANLTLNVGMEDEASSTADGEDDPVGSMNHNPIDGGGGGGGGGDGGGDDGGDDDDDCIDKTWKDCDGDGLDNIEEAEHGTDELDSDTDGDGLDDGHEVGSAGTDPTDSDTDDDGLDDYAEIYGNTDPTDADTDGDGLDDLEEVNGATDPTNSDTDGDSIHDYQEVHGNTDPTDPDTDGDGYNDQRDPEPTNPDVPDYIEPGCDLTDTDADCDNDRLPNLQEHLGDTDAWDPDTDDDGLDDYEEVELYPSDPANADTDGDGLDDWAETKVHSTNSTKIDTDEDGLVDSFEVEVSETDPTNPDTDGDGFSDGEEVENGWDPINEFDPLNEAPVTLPADAETITLFVEGESNLPVVAELYVAGPDGSETSYQLGPEKKTIDLSEFRGQDITISYAPEWVEYARIMVDTDGDTIYDSVERATQTSYTRIPRGSDENAAFELSPYSADTDGDGLRDDEEVDLDWELRDGGEDIFVTVLDGTSNPELADTDGDNVNDFDEQSIWFTDVFNDDSDRDGINDLVDERPNVEDTPAEIGGILVSQSKVELYARDDTGINPSDIVVNASHDSVWREFEVTHYSINRANETGYSNFVVDIDPFLGLIPEEYYVNVTDTNGNSISYHYVEGEGAFYPYRPVSVDVDGRDFEFPNETKTISSQGWESPRQLYVNTITTSAEEKRLERELPHTPKTEKAETYDPSGTPFGESIVLPEGERYCSGGGQRSADVNVQSRDEYCRVWGWEAVQELPGIEDTGDVGEVLEEGHVTWLDEDNRNLVSSERNGSATVALTDRNEDIRYVIADNPNRPGKVVLEVLGDRIVDASPAYETKDTWSIRIIVLDDHVDRFYDVSRSDETTTFEGERYDINVTQLFPDDGEKYVDDLGDDLSKGAIGEEAAAEIAKDRGYVIPDGFEKNSSNQEGIDLVAYDPDTGEYVFIEAKFTSTTGSVGRGILSNKSSAGKQMSDDWIFDALSRMEEKNIINASLNLTLHKEIRNENTSKEMVVVKNMERSSKTITNTLNDEGLEFDHVYIVKTGEVIE